MGLSTYPDTKKVGFADFMKETLLSVFEPKATLFLKLRQTGKMVIGLIDKNIQATAFMKKFKFLVGGAGIFVNQAQPT